VIRPKIKVHVQIVGGIGTISSVRWDPITSSIIYSQYTQD
ncbi:uncharacterized protein METZ01_LOCUS231876, partial [marine metagenome]